MAEPDSQKGKQQIEKNDQQATAETPLVEDVSADVAPVVGEFMEQAAQQNEAANEAVPNHRNKPGPYISFEHVYKSFGDFVVLEDVSFCVNPGETLCILGRSGVGKSVSLQILMGFLRADRGGGMVAGADVCGFSEREVQRIRQKGTMVFQNCAPLGSIDVVGHVAVPI